MVKGPDHFRSSLPPFLASFRKFLRNTMSPSLNLSGCCFASYDFFCRSCAFSMFVIAWTFTWSRMFIMTRTFSLNQRLDLRFCQRVSQYWVEWVHDQTSPRTVWIWWSHCYWFDRRTEWTWCAHCWRPKCNNCPKCNRVLNAVSLQCNPCCYSGHPHWDVEVTAVAPKNSQTNIHVTLRPLHISLTQTLKYNKFWKKIDNVTLAWLVMELRSHKPNCKLGQGSLLTCRSNNLQAQIYIFCLSMPE